MAKRINEMESQFIAGIKAGLTPTKSAKNAGYSLKSASQIGSQLMRKPKIINAIQLWKDSKRETVSKEDYIDMALKDYKSLEKTEPNAPRFMDIAGKALGYIGVNQDSRPNNTLIINATITGKEDRNQILENVRRLIQDNSQP